MILVRTHFFTSLFVHRLRELMDWWWNFKPFQKDCFLPLDSNVFRPFHESAKIPFRLDVLTCELHIGNTCDNNMK